MAGWIPKQDQGSLNIQESTQQAAVQSSKWRALGRVSSFFVFFTSVIGRQKHSSSAVRGEMIRSFYLVFLLVLATRSFAYYPASTRATRPLSHYFVEKVSSGNDAMRAMPLGVRRQREQQFAPRFAHPTRRLEAAGRRHSRYGRRTSRSLLRLSGVGSTTAPPPPTQVRSSCGGYVPSTILYLAAQLKR